MKFKKMLGVASLAATLTTTGILGGVVSNVGATPAIPMNRPGKLPSELKVAFTKAVKAPSDVPATEIPSLYYQFELKERDSEDVYTAGDPAELYLVDGTYYATKADAIAAIKIANPTYTDEQAATAADAAKVTENFKKSETGSLTGTKKYSVYIDPTNAQTYEQNNNAGRMNEGSQINPTQKYVDGDVTYYRHETSNFINDLTFTKEGIYAYDVVETQTAYKNAALTDAWTNVTTNPNPGNDWVEQVIEMSKQRYRMYIYVEKNEQDQYVIWAMTAVEVDIETGEIIKGEKKDMTSGGSTNVDGDLSNVQFDNAYKKVNHYEKDPERAGYAVQKTVEGVKNVSGTINGEAYDDEAVLFGKGGAPADEFDFTVRLTRNSMYTEDTEYIGQIWESKTGGTSWTKVGNQIKFTVDPSTGIAKYLDETTGAEKKVTLKHYQKLAFENVPVGTTYYVQDDNYADGSKIYGDASTVTPGAGSELIKYTKTTVNGEDVSVGIGGDLSTTGAVPNDPYTSVYRNNAKQGETPTGIITNILPFVVIIGGAAVALMVAVVVKGKRRSQEV